MFRSLFCAALGCFLLGCQPTPNPPAPTSSGLSPKADSLYKLVVAKHDSVMPKMTDIELLRAKLQTKLNTASRPEQKDSIIRTVAALQHAADTMMRWMNHFKNTELDADFYAKTSETQQLEYLQQQEKAIEYVGAAMRESIATGQVLSAAH